MSDPGPIPGYPGGDYGVSQIIAERAKLERDKNRLAKATDPFHALYYMIAEHLDVQALGEMEANINVMSGSLNDLQAFINMVNKIKADFMAGRTGEIGPDGPTNQAIRQDVAIFINSLVGQNILPENGSLYFFNDFNNALNAAGGASHTAVFTVDQIRSMINDIMQGFDVKTGSNSFNVFDGGKSLRSIWNEASSGTSTNVGGMPEPSAVQPYLDHIDAIEGLVQGMSGAETQEMSYAQKHYFGVVAFLKSMFNYYFKELKNPVSIGHNTQ